MALHRRFACVLLTVAIALVLVTIPLRVTLKDWRMELFLQSAFAKDGNSKGGGDGGGNDGGNGNGSAGKSAGKNAALDGGRHVNPSNGDVVQVSGTNVDVLHRNGMRERVKAGRYLMEDGKGRTIVERRATSADIARLRDMID